MDPGFKSPRTNLATQFHVGVIQNLQDLLLPSRSHNRSQGGPESPWQVVKRLRTVNGRTFQLAVTCCTHTGTRFQADPRQFTASYRQALAKFQLLQHFPIMHTWKMLQMFAYSRANAKTMLADCGTRKLQNNMSALRKKGVRSRKVKKHTQHDS